MTEERNGPGDKEQKPAPKRPTHRPLPKKRMPRYDGWDEFDAEDRKYGDGSGWRNKL